MNSIMNGMESIAVDYSIKEETNRVDKVTLFRKIYLFLRRARYFIPILTSIGWLIGFGLPAHPILERFALSLIFIGYVSTIFTCPIKMIKFVFSVALGAGGIVFELTSFLLIGAFLTGFIALWLGFVGSLMVVLFAPAAFTIYKYFTDSEYYGIRK